MEPPPLIAVEKLTAPPAGAGTPVLRGVSFAVRAGERVVLTGPSGSGKSTLLRCMVLLDPADGRVRLEGVEVRPGSKDARAGAAVSAGPRSSSGAGATRVTVRTLRRRVGYLPQRPVAIAGTIAENLDFPRGLGPPALDEAAQWRLLSRLGLGDVELSRRFDALSGGEQQRIALVRSMIARPDVLLLDEPAASLDPENVGAVTALLDEWAAESGRALIWVSHHSEQVSGLATRHVTMAELNP